MVLGRVVKLSGDASTRAGLAVFAGRRSRRSRHALTFHRWNVLLKTLAETPAGQSVFLQVSWAGATSLIAWHAEFISFVRQSHGG
jgi:hypothetical protein